MYAGETGFDLGSLIDIDEHEVEFRTRFLEITKSDEELLQKIGKVLDGHADEIIEAFKKGRSARPRPSPLNYIWRKTSNAEVVNK